MQNSSYAGGLCDVHIFTYHAKQTIRHWELYMKLNLYINMIFLPVW